MGNCFGKSPENSPPGGESNAAAAPAADNNTPTYEPPEPVPKPGTESSAGTAQVKPLDRIPQPATESKAGDSKAKPPGPVSKPSSEAEAGATKVKPPGPVSKPSSESEVGGAKAKPPNPVPKPGNGSHAGGGTIPKPGTKSDVAATAPKPSTSATQANPPDMPKQDTQAKPVDPLRKPPNEFATQPQPRTPPKSSQPQPRTPTKSQPQPHTPTKSEPQPQTPTKSHPPQTQTPTKSEPQPQTPTKSHPPQPQMPTKSELQPQTPTKSEPQPQTPTESHPPKPQTPTKSEHQPQTPTKSEPQPQTPTKSDPQPQTPTESHPPKPQTPTKSEPQPQTPIKPEPQPQTPTKSDPQSQTRPSSQPQTKSELESEVQSYSLPPPGAQSYSLPMPEEASYSLPPPGAPSYSLPPPGAPSYSLPPPGAPSPEPPCYSLPPLGAQPLLPLPGEQSHALPMPEIQSYSLPLPETLQVKADSACIPEEPIRPGGVEQPEAAVQNKPAPFKRLASVGLETDSVLGRKTKNVEEVYMFGDRLGQGQFGTTYACMEKMTGKDFACKTIDKGRLITDEDVEDVRRENQIMHHLAGHPNVIQIMGAYEDAEGVHLIMELCEGGELFDRIIERGHYTERKAAELARVIVGVVETCHSLGVIHRDLKPENFLFANQQEDAPLKAIDFGLSVFFRPGDTFHDVVGSPYYVAPEVLKKHYGPECDVWSAGVIIYILLCGVPPFWDETEQGIFDQVLSGDIDFVSDPWPSISDSGKDLVQKMLERDTNKRPTALEVLRHPWVSIDGEAPDKPLDSVVMNRMEQFSTMTKLKKLAIRVIAELLSEDEITGLKEMFKMMDTDGSGHITLEELKSGLEKVGAKIKDSELKGLMQAADINNSGAIDYGEFLAAMLHLNKVQKQNHLYAAFSYLDKDGSGYITKDEIQEACQSFGLQNLKLDDMIREVDQDNDGSIDYNEFVAMMQDTGFGKRK